MQLTKNKIKIKPFSCFISKPLQRQKDNSLTKQSTSWGPLHPAAHSMWQQSLGLVPKQRLLHCGAHTVLVTKTHRRDEFIRSHINVYACWIFVCVSVSGYFCVALKRYNEVKWRGGKGKTKRGLTDLALLFVWSPAIISARFMAWA